MPALLVWHAAWSFRSPVLQTTDETVGALEQRNARQTCTRAGLSLWKGREGLSRQVLCYSVAHTLQTLLEHKRREKLLHAAASREESLIWLPELERMLGK